MNALAELYRSQCLSSRYAACARPTHWETLLPTAKIGTPSLRLRFMPIANAKTEASDEQTVRRLVVLHLPRRRRLGIRCHAYSIFRMMARRQDSVGLHDRMARKANWFFDH